MDRKTGSPAGRVSAIALVLCLLGVLGSAVAAQESPAPSPTASGSPAPSAPASPSPSPEPPASEPPASEQPPSVPPASVPPASEPPASPAAESPSPEAEESRSPSPDESPAAAAGAQGAPPIVEANADAWPLANQDYAGHRSIGGAIDSTTIGDLGVAWTFPIESQSESGYGALATNPLILDGVVYFQDLTGNVYALDLESGEQIWKATYDVSQLGPNGVAVGYDKVFAVHGVSGVVALDIDDGSEVWVTDLQTQDDSEGVTIQPLVFGGRVYVSTVPGTSNQDFYSGGVAGILYALDQDTGDVVWSFSSVDSEDLWGNPEVNSGGGAWYSPTVEVRSGRTFWGIGNPGPFPGTEEFPSGSSRPGPNLYTDSVMAMTSDGQLEWFTQVRRHDLYDLDFQAPPILAQVDIQNDDQDGERNVVIGGGKAGEVVAMDRSDGEILWRTPVGLHKNNDVDPVPESGVEVLPGVLGGIETPMAFRDGVLFAAYLDAPTSYSPTSITQADTAAGAGGIVALDASNGNVLWENEYDFMPLGAVTAINDLVFTSTYDGRMFAIDRETGAEVWTMQSPAGINGWPAVAGDTILVPAGVGAEPMLIALRLGADGVLPTPPPASPSPEGSPAAGLTIATTPDAQLSFDKTELEAAAGAEVTVTYDNQVAVPHNIAFFEGDATSDPVIARTEIETGPVVQELTFTTPTEPGSYLFICEIHPETMRGQLVTS
jgi:alcohol dehydrogenase (cytochrome c)